MTATPIGPGQAQGPLRPGEAVAAAVGQQVGSWQNALLTPSRPDNAEVRATLARLRRTAASGPGAADGWAMTLPVAAKSVV